MRRLLLSALVLCGCSRGNGGLTASGTAEVTEVKVASVLPGRLASVEVREGDPVHKGALLFVLETADLQARRKVAEATLEQATAALEVAKSQRSATEDQLAFVESDFKRIESLAASHSISERERSIAENALTQARTGAHTAASALAAAEATRKQAAANLEAIDVSLAQASVVSPIDGVVLSRLREPGEVVTPGGAVVVLANLTRPWIRVYLPVTRLGEVKVGDNARVKSDSPSIAALPAVVTHVADEAEFTPKDVQTPEERVKQVFAVKLEVADSSGSLKAGMPVDVVFTPAATARR